MPNQIHPGDAIREVSRADDQPAPQPPDLLLRGRLSAGALGRSAPNVPVTMAGPGVPRPGEDGAARPPARRAPLLVEGGQRPDRPELLSRGDRRRRPDAAFSPNGWRGLGHARRLGVRGPGRYARAARRLGAHLLSARGVYSTGRGAAGPPCGDARCAMTEALPDPRSAA